MFMHKEYQMNQIISNILQSVHFTIADSGETCDISRLNRIKETVT